MLDEVDPLHMVWLPEITEVGLEFTVTVAVPATGLLHVGAIWYATFTRL